MSVVIPTHERPKELVRALDRLERQADPPTFEVVVVANHGDEREPVERAIGERDLDISLLQAAASGASAARNLGWRSASADLVLFLGDDILASPRLLREHVAWHHRHPDALIGVLGNVRWADEIRVTPFMRWLERGLQFDYGSIEGIDAGPGRLYTANVSLKRSTLATADGFDEGLPFLYEDIELGFRLAARGFRLLFNRRAEAEHLHAITPESWRRRMRIAARGEREFVARHPDVEPEMRRRMEAAAATPARGRLAPLVGVVPPWLPVLGRRVWRSAEQRWLRELAADYLSAWDEAEAASAATGERSGERRRAGS